MLTVLVFLYNCKETQENMNYKNERIIIFNTRSSNSIYDSNSNNNKYKYKYSLVQM